MPSLALATNPIDLLRQRLAEKLGGERQPGLPSQAAVVRIVNKSEVEATRIEPEKNRERRTRPLVQDNVLAARLAAAHRANPPVAEPAAAGLTTGAAIDANLAAAHAMHNLHWDYHGEGGPDSWGKLRPEFASCTHGTRQSPIDIREGLKLELDPVQFNYRPSLIRVIDNGHTVQVNVGSGNSIEVMGRRFELLQFHFHRPSEEQIDGRRFDMVAHLVHKDLDGKLAVIAVLLNRGAAQPLIQTVWNNLPLEKGMDQAVRAPVDLNALLPVGRDYFTYMGSLTTPPCTEGVLWVVMKTPVDVSAEQIGIFSRMYPMNARPLQAAGGRMIKESN